MPKFLVKRGDSLLEFDEESKIEKKDGDVVTKLFTQEDYNSFEAQVKRDYKNKDDNYKTLYDTANTELTTLKTRIATEQQEKETQLKTALEGAKKDVDEKWLAIVKRFEDAGEFQQALDTLNDLKGITPERPNMPKTPKEKGKDEPKSLGMASIKF